MYFTFLSYLTFFLSLFDFQSNRLIEALFYITSLQLFSFCFCELAYFEMNVGFRAAISVGVFDIIVNYKSMHSTITKCPEFNYPDLEKIEDAQQRIQNDFGALSELLKTWSLDNAILEFFIGLAIMVFLTIIPCSINVVNIICVIFLGRFLFIIVAFSIFWGRFFFQKNKTIISLALVVSRWLMPIRLVGHLSSHIQLAIVELNNC